MEKSILPDIYDIIPKTKKHIANNPAANPSSPSVRFTAFEVPVITVLLVLTNVSTPTSLSKKRPYVIVGAFVIGMLLTPPDVISQTLLAIPIWFLFEVGIIFARILTKHRNDSGVVLYDDIDKNNDKKDDK